MKIKHPHTWLGMGAIASMTAVLFYACKPDAVLPGLGAKAKADFAAVPSSTNPNTIILVNKSSTTSIPYWTVVNSGQQLSGDSAKVNFVFAGTYNVKLTAASNGGLDTITKPVTVAQSDPNACQGTPLGFIAGCTSKKWKLNPDVGAYKVGPSGPDDGSWWTSGMGEVTGRPCEFNDEYNFSFDANGTFVYDNKGDFYDDGYMGNKTNTCEPSANYTAVQQPWGSGNFRYVFTPNAGAKKLGQLQVIGLGAHIGLQKVTNGGEVTTGPVNSITYDVIEMTHNAAGYDILKLGLNFGPGWWTFTLRSY